MRKRYLGYNEGVERSSGEDEKSPELGEEEILQIICLMY